VAEVLFDKDGFAYIDLNIREINSPVMSYLEYKIDCGANRTTISKDFLNKLGYNNDWIKTGKLLTGEDRPTVATGEPIDDCYIVSLPEINIGDYVGYNWPFLTSLSVQFRNLLGTDTMSFFNWELDYENDICRFNLIKGKRSILFNQKEQSMHSLDGIEY
jgi:hypothetical protein